MYFDPSYTPGIPGGGAAPGVPTPGISPVKGRTYGGASVPFATPTQVGVGLGGGADPYGLLTGGQATQGEPIVGAIPAVAGALGLSMPAWLLAALGIAGAAYGGYQALGGGEGGGLFGLNILGGDDFQIGGLEFGGPGLPEPTAPYSEWHVGNKQFYYVPQYSPTTGKFLHAKVAMYNKDTKRWKVWTLPKPHLAVIGKNHPSHRMLTRLRHNLRRHTADAKTILQVSSPAYYAKMSGYHKHHRR